MQPLKASKWGQKPFRFLPFSAERTYMNYNNSRPWIPCWDASSAKTLNTQKSFE